MWLRSELAHIAGTYRSDPADGAKSARSTDEEIRLVQPEHDLVIVLTVLDLLTEPFTRVQASRLVLKRFVTVCLFGWDSQHIEF